MRIFNLAAAGAAAVAMAAPAAAVTLYSNNFDSTPSSAAGVTGVVTPGGAVVLTSSSGTGGGITGNWLSNQTLGRTEFTFSGLTGYTNLSLSFLAVLADSWDSTNGNPSPDYLDIYVNSARVARLTAANASGTVDDFQGGTSTFFGNTFLGGYNDRVINMGTSPALQNLSAIGDVLTLGIEASGAGFQPGSDESWGLDGLVLSGNEAGAAVPEPASWATMMLGFGLLGAALRRRRVALAA